MTDAEKIVQLEQKIADQDQRLIAIEKNGAVSGEQGKQNAKEIRRVERQTTDQFKQLVNLMNEGFARVETNLKNDIIRVETNLKNDINRMEERINRVEGQMIKWLTLIVGVAVIIISTLTYIKE